MIAGIDRSGHVDVQYEVRDGRIVERPVFMAEIPDWGSHWRRPVRHPCQ